MNADHLSEVFDLVEVRGLISGGFAVRGPWVSRAALEERLKFFAVVSGGARMRSDGPEGPIALDLEAGDVVVLNRRTSVELQGGTGDGLRREVLPAADDPMARLAGADPRADDILVGGRIELNDPGRALLSQALPPVAHVKGAAGANLRGSLHRLFEEASGNRMGSTFAIRQYGQLLLLEVLRAYVDQSEPPPGWLRLLADERLRPALRLMHARPEKPWGLEELAHAAAMSRTSFAERFRAVAGLPPLTYLHRWRMLLAQRALRDGDARVGALASTLGYASESAFSNAFKREVGESPLRYRNRVRAEATAAAPSS